MTLNLRNAKVVELVCDSCGYKACADGDMFCEDYRRASIVTREEYERRHVEEQRQVLGRVA